MDRRRLAGGIALIVLVAILGGLVWYDATLVNQPPTTAFAPAQTAEPPAPATSMAGPGAQTTAPDAGGAMMAAAPPAATAPDAGAAPDAGGAMMAAAPPAATAPDGGAAAPDAKTAMTAAPPAATTPDAAAAAPDTNTAMAANPPAATPPDAGAAAAPDNQVAVAAPTETPAPPAAVKVMPAPPGAPTFDVVRVEPTGDTVIAGQAEVGAAVEILDGQSTIAKSTADDRGEFAITLDKPLAPGAHDLAIRATSPDKATVALSDQRVTVAVPEAGSKDVLVVMNTPDSASKVLQVPDTGAQVAVATPDAGTAPGVAAGTGTEAATAAPQTQATEATPPGGSTTGTEQTPGQVASAPPTADQAPKTGTEQTAGGVASEPTTTAETPTTGTEKTPGELASAPPAGDTTPAPGAATEPTSGQVASAPPAAQEGPNGAETPAAVAPPATDTQQAETTAPAGDNGVAAAKEPPVKAEPEVATEAPVTTEPQVKAEPPVAGETEVATAETNKAAAPSNKPEPKVVVSAVEADTSGNVFVAGTATTGDPVRAYIDDTPIGDATPSPSGTFLVETQRDMPAGQYTIRIDQLDEHGQVIARSEVPFEKEVEVAVLTPTGTADASGATGAAVSGTMPEMETVIIKRRDNLWRIARREWGKGVRWSTIYQANTDQIRNPHWIYPGQVFLMPKGSTNWTTD